MKNEHYAELFQYCSSNEIWVLTWYNKIKILKTPFRVKVLQNIGELKIGSYVKVDEVKLASNGKTIFKINDKYYYYHHFKLYTHL